MTHCLVVDDDPDIRTSLQTFLQRFEMTVSAAANGYEMRRQLATTAFDVVVLDLMLPDENGLVLCRWAQQTHGVPVIMLTAQGDPASRVLGLEMGADDYLGKPFEPRELVARIHAVLRRVRKGAFTGIHRMPRIWCGACPRWPAASKMTPRRNSLRCPKA